MKTWCANDSGGFFRIAKGSLNPAVEHFHVVQREGTQVGTPQTAIKDQARLPGTVAIREVRSYRPASLPPVCDGPSTVPRCVLGPREPDRCSERQRGIASPRIAAERSSALSCALRRIICAARCSSRRPRSRRTHRRSFPPTLRSKRRIPVLRRSHCSTSRSIPRSCAIRPIA